MQEKKTSLRGANATKQSSGLKERHWIASNINVLAMTFKKLAKERVL